MFVYVLFSLYKDVLQTKTFEKDSVLCRYNTFSGRIITPPQKFAEHCCNNCCIWWWNRIVSGGQKFMALCSLCKELHSFPKTCRVFSQMRGGGAHCCLPAVSCFSRWCLTSESTKFFLISFQKARWCRGGNAIQTFACFTTSSDDTLHLLKFCMCYHIFAYMQGPCEWCTLLF